MRDSVIHEQVYFEFVKNHDQLHHIYYSDTPIFGQKIVGVKNVTDDETLNSFFEEQLRNGGVTIINPDYDCFYTDFINLTHNIDSIEYIKNKIESSSREDIVEYTILNLQKIIKNNILANTVYVVVYEDWPTDWLDEIIEV